MRSGPIVPVFKNFVLVFVFLAGMLGIVVETCNSQLK